MDSEIPFGPSPPKRDTDLIALLPPKNSEYSFDRLSPIETAALEAALADGFRGFAADKRFPKSTPRSVDAGLLRHPFYVRENSEYDPVEYDHEFWSTRTDAPPRSVIGRLADIACVKTNTAFGEKTKYFRSIEKGC